MALQDIQKALQELAMQDKLTFADVGQQAAAVALVMVSLPPLTTVKLSNPQISLAGEGDEQKLTVADKVTWGILDGVSAEIVITPDTTASGKYLAQLTFQAPASVELAIPGVDWFEMGQFQIGGYNLPFDVASSALAPDASLIEIGATLIIKGDSSQTSIPIKIDIDPTGVLLLRLNTASIDLPSINNVLAAFGNTDGILLPDTINQIAHFSLLQLQVGFDPQEPVVTLIGVEIGNSAQADKDWQIIPGVLSLHSYTIGLTIVNPLTTRSIGGLIAAQMKLGKVDIDIYALHPASGGWQFRGEIGQDSPVPIGDVLLGISQQFGVPLPDALHQFTMKDFVIAFDTSTGKTDCTLTLDFTIAGQPFELSASLSLEKGEDGKYKPPTVQGKLQVSTSTFTVTFDNTAGASTFTGEWQDSENPLTFANLASALGFDAMPSLDLDLVEAKLTYDFADATLVLEGTSSPNTRQAATVFQAIAPPAAIADLTIEKLAITFHTLTRHFTFACETSTFIGNTSVALSITLDLLPGDKGYTKKFGGTVTVGTRQFILFFSEDATSTLLLAEYANPGGDKIKIREDLVAPLSADIAQYIPAALEIDFKDVLFVFDRGAAGTQPTFLFGLELGATIPSLSNLPLVGQELSAEQNIKVDNLRVLFASQALTANLVASVNGLLMSEITPLPAIGLSAGLTLSAAITFGSTPQILTVPIAGVGTPATPTPSAPGTTSTNNATWFSLQKSFGPLHFNRVGVQYQDAAVWFLLDAALSLAGLTLSLDGLAVGSPLTPFAPEFQLRGLGLAYQSGPLEIDGSFLHTKQTLPNGTRYDEYDGAALIKTEELTISALGSYALLGDNPSLFIYAVLDYPLGGPSFFFVTGLAAGFGYNRSLTVPVIDQIAQFPLVAEAVSGATPPQSINDIGNELAKLEQYIHPEVGETFFAVGIRFTSFKIIDSFVLVTVAFGNELEVDVLGLSTLILPTPVPDEPPVTPLAVVQMAVKASYIPAQGFLGVSAQLTSASYVLSNNCLLTGGFAFYSWFAGEHNGDFVQTLGGYHPSFVVPAHYPTVPRLGYSWQVDSQLSIKGQAYCALTASALMAGMQIQANWESGNLRAWFSASFDFLISWKPFHYDISAHVNLGASYTFWFFGTQTVSFDVGADLHIWGPEFSGTAHINLSIISFDVSFGANSAPSPTPIDWVTFKKSFLPADTDVAGISVKAGLLNKTSQDDSDLGVLDPKTFSLVTNSVVPSTSSRIATGQDITAASTTGNGFQPYTASGKPAQTLSGTTAQAFGQVAIGPMGVQIGELVSTQTITITHNGTHVEDQFVYTPVLKNVPVGLWGHSLQPDLNGPRFVDNAFAGFEIAPAAPSVPGETAMLDRQALRYEPETIPSAYAWASNLPAFEAEQFDDVSGRQKLSATLAAPAVATARQQVLAALEIDASAIDLSAMLASTLANEYVSAPQVEKV